MIHVVLLAVALTGHQPGAVHYSKRALLVGAWDYRCSRWGNLHSAHDVNLVADVLEKKFGFRKEDGGEIVKLTSRAETTRKSIFDSFRRILTTDVREGDTFYFHYSGHGYYTPDVDPKDFPEVAKWAPNNPIIGNGKQGLDTTLLPTDDPAHDANQIRGDELGLLIQRIKDAAKGKKVNIFVTLDCCHSGMGTRGPADAPVRGRNYDGPTNLVPKQLTPATDPVWKIDQPEGYTTIEACQSDQEAREDLQHKCGRLTWALCTSLAKCDKTTSYRELFDMIDAFMSSNYTFDNISNASQNPMIEGDQDRGVFGSAAVPEPHYYALLKLGNGRYKVKAGAMKLITEGTVLKLYRKSDNPDDPNAKSFGEATATKLGIEDADLKFNGPAPSSNLLEGAKAVVACQGAESNVLTVDLSDIRTSPYYADIKTRLAALKTVKVVEAPGAKADLAVYLGNPTKRGPSGPSDDAKRYCILRATTGSTVDAYALSEPVPINIGGSSPDEILAVIKREVRSEAFHRLTNEFPGQQNYVEVRIRPCEAPGGEFSGLLPPPKGQVAAAIGSHFALEYRVHGNWITDGEPSDPFVAIIDLSSDSGADLLWPSKTHASKPAKLLRDLQLSESSPGGWRLVTEPDTGAVATYKVGKPLGGESLKVIASQRAIPFFSIFSGGSKDLRDGLSPLGRLVDDFAEDHARSASDDKALGDEAWSTRVVSFRVVDR